MRNAEVIRSTAETEIKLRLSLDGSGSSELKTGCGFLEHMLCLFARHGGFDLELSCVGDTWVDFHHSVEDIGIALGAAFRDALGDKQGVGRYGFMLLPMDEALVQTAVDLSGRAHLSFDAVFPAEKIGMFDTELVKEFWLGFVRSAQITLHVRMLAGENSHHIAEAIFKSVARSLKAAVRIDPNDPGRIPSTKGVL